MLVDHVDPDRRQGLGELDAIANADRVSIVVEVVRGARLFTHGRGLPEVAEARLRLGVGAEREGVCGRDARDHRVVKLDRLGPERLAVWLTARALDCRPLPAVEGAPALVGRGQRDRPCSPAPAHFQLNLCRIVLRHAGDVQIWNDQAAEIVDLDDHVEIRAQRAAIDQPRAGILRKVPGHPGYGREGRHQLIIDRRADASGGVGANHHGPDQLGQRHGSRAHPQAVADVDAGAGVEVQRVRSIGEHRELGALGVEQARSRQRGAGREDPEPEHYPIFQETAEGNRQDHADGRAVQGLFAEISRRVGPICVQQEARALPAEGELAASLSAEQRGVRERGVDPPTHGGAHARHGLAPGPEAKLFRR